MAKKRPKIRIFSALEVANICGVVNQTAINWIKNGHLEAFTTPGGQYRVYAETLYAFLKERGMKVPRELLSLVKMSQNHQSVIIVDDDKAFNDMLKEYLEKKLPEAKIMQAYNGFEAGRTIAEVRPSIVILDIDLPGLNGTELCGQIKHDESFGKPAVIIVTGLDDELVEKSSLDAGADAFFLKPFDFSALVELIEKLFDRKSSEG